jgi:hypothetical protein
MHQGCIDHDACYDRCNAAWGCGTWEAAYCRHGRAETLPTIAADLLVRGYEYCDEVAWLQYPTAWTALWVRGYGPQPLRQVFEYTDLSQGLLSAQLIRDLEKCPLPAEGGAEAPKPASGDQPPPAPPAGDRWRLADVQIKEFDCGSWPIREESGAFGQQSVSVVCDGEEFWGTVHTEGTMRIGYPDRLEGGQMATFTVQAEGSMTWELTDATRSGRAVLQLVMNVDRASNVCGHTVSPDQAGGATGSATLRVDELSCSYDPVADLGNRDEVKIMFKFWPSAGYAGTEWYHATGTIDLTYERCSSPDDC